MFIHMFQYWYSVTREMNMEMYTTCIVESRDWELPYVMGKEELTKILNFRQTFQILWYAEAENMETMLEILSSVHPWVKCDMVLVWH